MFRNLFAAQLLQWLKQIALEKEFLAVPFSFQQTAKPCKILQSNIMKIMFWKMLVNKRRGFNLDYGKVETIWRSIRTRAGIQLQMFNPL